MAGTTRSLTDIYTRIPVGGTKTGSAQDIQDLAKSVVFRDDSNPPTVPISGVTPTADAHFATKGYVDGKLGRSYIDFSLTEARPLAASASYSNLMVWWWTDLRFQPSTGNTNQTDWTYETYRDTAQAKYFVRHDQNNYINFDFQMPHEWAGTAVRFHGHTIPMADPGVAQNAYWSGAHHFGGVGDELPELSGWTQWTATQTVQPTTDVYKRAIVSFQTITPPASPGNSDILSIRVARLGDDASDTYTTSKTNYGGQTAAANLCIESFDVHYQRLATGSEEPFTGSVIDNPSRVLFDPSAYIGDVYLQMLVKCDSGNSCSFQLYDVTGAAAVTGSSASTTSTSYELKEVGPLTLTSGLREYRIQGKYDSVADEPKLVGARFVVR